MTFFSDTHGFTSIKEENPYSAPLAALETAVSRAGGELKLTDAPDGRSDEELFEYVNSFSAAVADASRRRSELATQLESCNKDIEQYEHFIGLNIDLESILACETIKVRFGRLPKESFEKLKAYNENPYVLFFPGTSDTEYYWGVYFSPIEFSDDVDRIFSSLYFERLRIPSAIGTPKEIVAHLRRQREELTGQLEEQKAALAALWEKERPGCVQVYSRLKELNYFFDVRRYAALYNDKFILAGWIPRHEEKTFRAKLDDIDAIEYTFEHPDEDTHHTPPVKLRNAGVFRPFEFFVDMYGLPRYNEVDPTAFVAITYTILFGIMFGDVGQGLLVTLIGWLMWKFKKMAIGRILIPCGVSSAVFGLVYGSVFGFEHLLDPMYRALFGWKEKPVEVMTSAMTTKIILLAVVIGLVLIIVSMLLNIVSSLKRRDYESGFFGANGIAGLVFYASLILGFAGQMLLDLHLLTLPYVLLLIVLPLLLIFMREPLGKLAAHDPDWKPESWGGFIVQNFFELFELMLSYVSNTMSFLRVGAFVLVHAGMMMAVFTLAELAGGVGYWAIIVFGNALVMCMEALLVAIQVLRLEYYEMFSRYYIGDGRPFRPLSVASEEKR